MGTFLNSQEAEPAGAEDNMERRNRRDALRLLAGGTATAVGASVIYTSTAFADSGSATCVPSGWPANEADFEAAVHLTSHGSFPSVLIDLDHDVFANITCDAGPPERNVRWSLTSPSNSARLLSHLNTLTGGGTFELDTWSASMRNQARVTGPSSTSSLNVPGTYVVTVQLRFICNDGKRCWRCVNIRIQFNWTGSAITLPDITTTNNSPDCNTGLLA